MYRELLATVYRCRQLNLGEIGDQFQKDADDLKAAIQQHCWDEWLGFFYTADLNLRPVPIYKELAEHDHRGQPRAGLGGGGGRRRF